MKYKILLIILIGIITIFLNGCQKQEIDVFSLNLREHKDLALHIHPYVEIEILGENFEIPADIGISDLGMRVIHTHDTTGKLHIEAPVPHQFYLGDLFTIWGERFNSSCIFEFCTDDRFELKVYSNGIETKLDGRLPIYDGDLIKIEYKER